MMSRRIRLSRTTTVLCRCMEKHGNRVCGEPLVVLCGRWSRIAGAVAARASHSDDGRPIVIFEGRCPICNKKFHVSLDGANKAHILQ